MVDVCTRSHFGTLTHQATYDNCSEGHESCQGAENARASCGKGEKKDEGSANACQYWFIVIVREHWSWYVSPVAAVLEVTRPHSVV